MDSNSSSRTNGERKDHDLLGDLEIPDEVYYGVRTARSVSNFVITGSSLKSPPQLIRALAAIKHAAAVTNFELKLLDP